MAVVVADLGVSTPCCKPTKDQLAWIATRLRWGLDAFYLTRFLPHHSPDHRRGLRYGSGKDTSPGRSSSDRSEI